LLGAPPASAAEAVDHKVVDALERDAYSLRTVEPGGDTTDLRALDRMIGHARVVGVGEATHSSHDFFALKDRVFRHLVEEKGFRTFALEGSWSTGLRLNDYVLYGKGDPRRIMSEEFQSEYVWWKQHRLPEAGRVDACVQRRASRRPGPLHGRRLRVDRT